MIEPANSNENAKLPLESHDEEVDRFSVSDSNTMKERWTALVRVTVTL